METLLRPATRTIRSYKVCHSCLQRLQTQHHHHHPTLPFTSAHLRTYHASQPLDQNTSSPSSTQAHPLGAFYADLLAQPIPSTSRASSTHDLPSFVSTPSTTDLSREERAAKLFGNVRGSGYERRTSTTPDSTWQTINGVAIPPRPLEPENCCMSGCVHCVWDDYRDDVEEWAGRVKKAQAQAQGKGSAKAAKVEMPRQEVEVASASMDDDGGGSESLWDAPGRSGDVDGEELFKGIPIGIREFMNVEKKIRERKRERREKGLI